MNTARTVSALPANARSQPRTVDAGRPTCAAIRRCPAPVALARSAAPITSTPSARRSRHDTASSTCVTRHVLHRARRGRRPPTPRTARRRACPHGARPPPHGQNNSPARRRRSTSTTSLPTMTTGASKHQAPALPSGQRKGKGRCASQNVIRLSSHTNKGLPAGSPRDHHRGQRRPTTAPSSGGVPFNTCSSIGCSWIASQSMAWASIASESIASASVASDSIAFESVGSARGGSVATSSGSGDEVDSVPVRVLRRPICGSAGCTCPRRRRRRCCR